MITDIFEVVRGGDFDLVERLLASGLDVDSRDAEGATILMLTAHTGNLPLVKSLLDAGANVEAPISCGIRPLMLAAGYGEAAVVEARLHSTHDGQAEALCRCDQSAARSRA